MKELNEIKFNRLHREVRYLLDHSYLVGYNEGDIRAGINEGWKHYLAKCVIVRLLKEGMFPTGFDRLTYGIKRVMREEQKTMDKIIAIYPYVSESTPKLKKWQKPFIYTEAKFSDKLEGDILAVTIDGAYVIEIIDKEEEKSLTRKKLVYSKMGMNKGIKINFVEVRV